MEKAKKVYLEDRKSDIYESIDPSILKSSKGSIDYKIQAATNQRQLEETISDIFDREIEREVLKRPLKDVLLIKIPKGDMEYKVLKQPSIVDYWMFQTDKERNSAENSKVHVQRTNDGIINWLGVGPMNDKYSQNEKNLKAVDMFMKRTDDKVTIQKMDEDILEALGLKNNKPWKSSDNGVFQVMEERKAFRVPERTDLEISSFPTVAAVRTGMQLFDEGNQKFQNYERRYDTLLAALNSFCSKACNWSCGCPIEKLNSEITMVKEKFEDPYKHVKGRT